MIAQASFAFRQLKRSFEFTIMAAWRLGLGANTTVFAFINAFFLRGIPFAHPDLVSLHTVLRSE